jgi:hypothetical protein
VPVQGTDWVAAPRIESFSVRLDPSPAIELPGRDGTLLDRINGIATIRRPDSMCLGWHAASHGCKERHDWSTVGSIVGMLVATWSEWGPRKEL